MKIALIITAALLAILVLYFLLNVFSPKQNKVNQKLRITKKRHAALYLTFSLALTPLLVFAADYDKKMSVANGHGFDTYEAYQAELKKAESFGLSLPQYQAAMKNALAQGFTHYQDYQNQLIASEHGYKDYADYKRDLTLSEKYGLPLAVYKQTKAESDAKNFKSFDEYLIHLEKESLTKKLPQIATLSGDYNIDSVPLGIKKNELLSLVDDCKITAIPDYSFPITNTLAPRNGAQVSHFFPETPSNNNFGLTPYSMNFSIMPGLDRQAITKHEMKCESSRYNLWFLNSDDSLVMYEKTIHMPNIRRFEETVNRIENILTSKCDTELSVGLETTFEENGERQIKNLYCKNFQEYLIATIVDGPIITGVRQDPDIHIGYLNDRLWKKYVDDLHAAKNKRRTHEYSQARPQTQTRSQSQNQTKTIESRI